MGSGSSKVAGKAAAAAGRRQYPSTSSILNSASSTGNAPSQGVTSGSQVRPSPSAAPPSSTKAEHIELDARDPHFGSKLRELGPAISVERARPGSGAFPTSSSPPLGQQGNNIFPSSNPKTNPSLVIVQSEERIRKQWDLESESLGRSSFVGRTLISAKEIKDVLNMRDQGGMKPEDIEKQLRLKNGVIAGLGGKKLVANA